MADLESLVRLKKHQVEEKQKVLADILRQVEALEAKKEDLFARLQKEREALEDNLTLETREYYGRFEGVIRADAARIDDELVTLETRLTIVQDEVRAAFADKKRVEIVYERRQAEEAREIRNKEERELDEIGLEGFRRKDD